MKSLTVVFLLIAPAALAQPQAPREICIVIEHQITLDKSVELCPILRAQLPRAKRTPWSPAICLREAAVRTFKEINREQTEKALKLSLKNLDNLDTQVEPTPEPVPTPTATPTPEPTATP